MLQSWSCIYAKIFQNKPLTLKLSLDCLHEKQSPVYSLTQSHDLLLSTHHMLHIFFISVANVSRVTCEHSASHLCISGKLSFLVQYGDKTRNFFKHTSKVFLYGLLQTPLPSALWKKAFLINPRSAWRNAYLYISLNCLHCLELVDTFHYYLWMTAHRKSFCLYLNRVFGGFSEIFEFNWFI